MESFLDLLANLLDEVMVGLAVSFPIDSPSAEFASESLLQQFASWKIVRDLQTLE